MPDPASVVRTRSDEASTAEDMVWIAGGEFDMGSDHHYPEEAPRHRVRVDGFWMDRTPVTVSPVCRVCPRHRPRNDGRDRA